MPIRMSALLRPFEDFFKSQVAGGILLLAATLVALMLANSQAAPAYVSFWHTKIGFTIGHTSLELPLHYWINDGLMAVFFFVVGLEIKRELLAGELAAPTQAALPIAAALGGMVVPALIYLGINLGRPTLSGWGIPMATDIAFALGVIALLGDHIPRSLAIFLTALAIVDDLGAVLIIALFYTGDLNPTALWLAAGLFALLVVGSRIGIQTLPFYLLFGLLLWLALLNSGIHASITGVLVGAVIPVRPRHNHAQFLASADTLMAHYLRHEDEPGPFQRESRLGTLLALEHVCHDAMSPLQRLEHSLHSWVIYGVMPIFALANAGVRIRVADLPEALVEPVTVGVGLGLLLGKPLGIFLFSWLAVRCGVARLANDLTWKDIVGAGFLAGIGFTMSIFITALAFGSTPAAPAAKIGIFAGSLLAGGIGFLLLRRRPVPTPDQPVP